MYKKVLLLIMIFLPAVLLWGCGKKTSDSRETLGSQVELDENEMNFDDLARGEVKIEVQDLVDYASGKALLNEQMPEQMKYFLEMPQIPKTCLGSLLQHGLKKESVKLHFPIKKGIYLNSLFLHF